MSDSAPRVAVVTGAASGIGAAVARDLTERGWVVASLDLATAPACAWSGVVDMRDAAAVSRAISLIEQELGPVGAAVSVAGYYEMLAITDITREQWDRMLAVHLGGLVNLSRAVLPVMVARGSGSVVAITSELAIGGGADDSHYAAAKGAIIGVVKSLSVEMAPHGIRVNAVAPGPTDTPLLASDSPWRAPAYLATLPIGRLGSPEEVALCVGWLIDEDTFCAGEILHPNAGSVI